jgi:hypothetical protein
MQNGEGNYDLEDERRERKDGDNLHGAIALPGRHFLKEQLILVENMEIGTKDIGLCSRSGVPPQILLAFLHRQI